MVIPKCSLAVLLLSQLMFFAHGLVVLKRNDDYTMNQHGIRWHRTCKAPNPANPSESKRAAIERAWAGAMELSDSAWQRFEGITAPELNGPLSKSQQDRINREDPAYVQMFALDWSKRTKNRVLKLLRTLVSRANADPGTNKRPPTSESKLAIFCDDTWEKDSDDVATTINDVNPNDDEKWGNVDMNFFREFFFLPRYDRLKLAAQVDEPYEKGVTSREFQMVRRMIWSDENYSSTDAATVLHEITHMWWIGLTNTDPGSECDIPETYGLYECAKLAWNEGHPIANNIEVNWNADTYALYAEYGRFVELLGKDPWRSYSKPVKLPVRYS